MVRWSFNGPKIKGDEKSFSKKLACNLKWRKRGEMFGERGESECVGVVGGGASFL